MNGSNELPTWGCITGYFSVTVAFYTSNICGSKSTLHSKFVCEAIFESISETNGVCSGLKKKPFQQTCGINSELMGVCIYLICYSFLGKPG